jgi:hypothetical protein
MTFIPSNLLATGSPEALIKLIDEGYPLSNEQLKLVVRNLLERIAKLEAVKQ